MNHFLTLKFLRPQNDFRGYINDFVNGKPRSELPELFSELLPWKFTPIVERYIEAGHSQVKSRACVQHVGPGVSLARRLRRLEQQLKLRPELLLDVTRAFSLTRKLVNIPHLLGIAMHPNLPTGAGAQRLKTRRDLFCKKLNLVLYRADVENIHRDVSAPKKHNELRRARLALAEARVSKPKQQPLSLQAVMLEAICDHVKRVTTTASEFRFRCLSLPLPLANATMQPLTNALEQKAGPLRTGPERMVIESDVQSSSLGRTTLLELASSKVFFTVLKSEPSRWKTVHVSPVAGGKIQQHSLIVARNNAMADADETPIQVDR